MVSIMNVNDYIRVFLDSRDESISNAWSSPENQVSFASLFQQLNRNDSVSSKKKKKDPTAPKRGTSSYLYFCHDERSVIQSEHHDMSAKEITSELGRRWNKLKTDDARRFAEYEAMAVADRTRYEAEKASYVPSEDFAVGTKGRKKDPNAPKRCRSAYIIFCAQERDVVKDDEPNMSAKEITSELGRRWNQLKTDNPRRIQEFERLAEEDKTRYESEKSAYVGRDVTPPKTTKPSKKASKKKTSKEEEAKKVKKEDAKKVAKEVKKEEVNGFELFSQHNRATVKADNPGMKPRDITKLLSRMWRNISDEEKEEYKNL